jgi:3-oxoacyl-[acyl-carrier-protein] synthase-3
VQTSILSTGSYLPEFVVTNDDLARVVDTSDDWIWSHIGIRERRIARDEQTSDLADRAARRALGGTVATEDLDGIIVATQTPDKPVPATACILQHRLSAPNCFALDINAACSGFVYALHLAAGLIQSNMARRILVVGAERMSRLVDWRDRRTCVIFADGAGALVLGGTEDGEPRLADLLDTIVFNDGTGEEVIHVPLGGSSNPVTAETVDSNLRYVQMDGRRVFTFAQSAFVQTIRALSQRNGVPIDKLAHVIPHQANMRIIEAAMNDLALPMSRAVTHLERYGNTCAASIPIALDEEAIEGRFATGDLLALVTFGTGLAWGGALLRWRAQAYR